MAVSWGLPRALRNDVKEFYVPERSAFEKNKLFLQSFGDDRLRFVADEPSSFHKRRNAMLKNLLVIGALLGKLAIVGLAPQPSVGNEADCPYCPTPECFPGDCEC